jgi:hypothetical protein
MGSQLSVMIRKRRCSVWPGYVLPVILLTCLGWSRAEETRVPLETTIPQPVLVGTPPDVLIQLYPHLPPPEEPPQLLVPPGTANLALHQPVTSSDPLPVIGELSYVTDGKKSGLDGTAVELGPMAQWVQIDLGRPSIIHAIHIWHYFLEARSYHDVVVQIADDAEFTRNVRTVYNNDQDNTLKLGIGKDRPYIETNFGKLIDTRGVPGRFVRLHSRGNTANDLNHYVEVEVFGIAAP